MGILSSITGGGAKGAAKGAGDAPKGRKKKGAESAQGMKLRRTVQESIPYDTVYPNGIIETSPGRFSKSYKLEDVNFKTAEQSQQNSMFLDYEGLLNGLDPGMVGQVTVVNRSVDPAEVKNRLLIHPKNDSLNRYRDEYNSIIQSKMQEGRNNLIKEKYYTVSIAAQDITMAATTFGRLDSDINSKVARINRVGAPPMGLQDRLSLLYDIYNEDPEMPFDRKIAPLLNRQNGVLDLRLLARAGLSTKDLIGPDSMSFSKKSSMFTLGRMYGRAMFLDNFPTFMNSDILADLSDMPCNMVTSVLFRPIPPDKSATMVKHQITNLNENIVRYQKRAARGGYDGAMLPSELKRAKEEADALREDMTSRNQKLFYVTVVMVIFAEDMEDLDLKTESLKSVGTSHLCQVRELQWQQESGFNTALPLGSLELSVDRVLTTESSAVFIPFSVQELSQDGGHYYGLNGVSRSLIMYNRLNGDNYNGLIFGKPGSGKSFIAKTEMIDTILSTDDDIFVIDPEGEYTPLAKAFDGQVVKIATGSKTYLNPLDMDIQYASSEDSNDDPIAMKCDFLTSMCETILGHGNLDPIMVNLIHRCGRRIYRPYYEHMQEMLKRGITIDTSAAPTLVDFYTELTQSRDQRGQMLAAALEMYCIGNYDLFAKQTNVEAQSRFLIYDIKDVPAGTKELALQICMNDVWNKIIANRKKNRKTWFYIDEFHVLLQSESSARFMKSIYKRARKWGGIPTGITQNVEDLLVQEDARAILNTSNFLIMMNQSQIDRAELAKMFSISDSLLDYITEKPHGTGLIYNGKTTIPFINEFPAETELYRIINTKPVPDAKEAKAGGQQD